MNLIHEYALLIAAAAPVAVVVALNVWLAFNGERDTLLIPTLRAYPKVAMPELAEHTPAEARAVPALAPVHEEPLRQAA